MHIAYLIQEFHPELGAGPARALEMARRWVAEGARVTVLTGMPCRKLPGLEDGEIHQDYRGRLFVREPLEGFEVVRSWVFSRAGRGFGATALNNLSFLASAPLAQLFHRLHADVLIASSPPFFAHAAGLAIAKTKGIPLVLEVRDLWPDYLVELGMVKNPLALRLLFGMEGVLFSQAQGVVTVTESFRRRVRGKGAAEIPVEVISNGVDRETYFRPSSPNGARRSAGSELVIGYLGTFGRGQGLEVVLEAARLLEDRSVKARIALVGDGPLAPALRQRSEELRLMNVSIGGPIPKSETRAFYRSCDVCLVPLAPVPIFAETVPSKIFEIMACGVPVVASVEGEARSIVERSGGGWVVPPGDAPELAGRLSALVELPPEELEGRGRDGSAFVERHYDRGDLAVRYLSFLERVAGHSGTRTAKEVAS